MKVEVAVFEKDDSKFLVMGRTDRNTRIINYENPRFSSVWGKKEPFISAWEMTREEFDEFIKALREDLTHLAKVGESGVLEIGGPALVGTPLAGIEIFGNPPLEEVNKPLFIFTSRDYAFNITRMEFAGSPPKPPLDRVIMNEILLETRNYIEATVEIQKRKNALRRLRLELPTNVDEETFQKFIPATTPEIVLARGNQWLEKIQLNPLEELVSSSPTIYASYNRRRFMVIDPTTSLANAIYALIDNNYDVHPAPVQLWMDREWRQNGFHGQEVIKMTKNSIFTVRGLITTMNRDGHLFLLSMYTKNGKRTAEITNDFYRMIEQFTGYTKNEVGKVISEMRWHPANEVATLQKDFFEDVLKEATESKDFKELKEKYSFLPEPYLRPFNLYMLEKRETLLVLTRNSYTDLPHIIAKEALKVLS